ncbi:MAG: T9SS type A sorting domain-containing protein [Chitinophagaceae bacterium]|nr:T9SS type A sorting domain-containing protein [Chitinophagaceae bacterium]
MSKLYKALTRIACSLFVPLCISNVANATIFTVTSNASSGAGSLAQAILDANANSGADIIEFNLPAGSLVINLTGGLPAITDVVTINGYSQPTAVQGTIAGRTILVQVDGGSMGGNTDIFTINSPNVTIAGLAITRATRYGIYVSQGANNAFIWGNYFGTDATGITGGLGNNGAAIAVNTGNGPGGATTTGVVVGVKDDGTNDANEGNLISGSTGGNGEGDGIIFWNTQNSVIAGNIIGLEKTGMLSGFGNARNGILLTVTSNNNTIGTNGNGVSDALEGNIIGRNGGRGVLNFLSHFTRISGNKIGLTNSNSAAPNGLQGIHLMNSHSCLIGTDGVNNNSAVEANLIGFNNSEGIRLSNENFLSLGLGWADNTNDNTIAGNGIGTDLAGTLVAANQGSGIYFVHTGELPTLTVANNIVGSNNNGTEDAAEANHIANNNNGGIVLSPAAAGLVTGNKFSRNSIFNNNSLLGIDLNADNVTSNDDGDTDNGVNGLFNFPVITSVEVNSGKLIVQGFSRPNSVIEFYIADAGPNPNPLPGGYTTSFGEGQNYLFRGQDDASLDAPDAQVGTSGTYTATQEGTGTGGTRTEARFSFTIDLSSLPVAVTAGTRITALAYENATGAGNTSEFGPVSSIVATPVRLLSLDATLNNGKVYINWKTAEEINNDHFEILKATDGAHYKSIATISAKGNNSSYQFIDNNPDKVNMYKLRQVDIDGRTTDSKILVVRTDMSTITLKASPNPFGAYLNINYKLDRDDNIRVKLYSFSGALVRTYNIKGNKGVNTTGFTDLGNLPAGNYTIELSGSSISLRQQVIKQ